MMEVNTMPNLIFIGVKKKDAKKIVGCLAKLIPQDMEDAVSKAYPDDAPTYVISGDPAPYVIVRDSDREQAIRIKDNIQKIDSVYGPLDVEVELIEFFEGGGKMASTETDGSR
jgi:hypothetical protein